MEDELKTQLRLLGDEFLAHSKLAPGTMWARAANDARFLDRVEGGKSFTVKTFDRAIQWFSDNWPDDAVWPAHVSRPFLTSREKVDVEAAE